MTEVAVVDIDIGKTSFHLIGLDVAGSIQWKKKLMATIWDADILIYCASVLADMARRGINDVPR